MSNQTSPRPAHGARFSPASGLASLLGWFSSSRKKYGGEWWILTAGALIIALILVMTVFPRAFTSYSPVDQNAGGQMTAPSRAHIMGTDNLSRDVWARVVYGAQTILGVAMAAALLSAIIGIPLGLLSGFAGGVFDRILSLIMDSVYSFPGLILAIAFAAMLGPGVINITSRWPWSTFPRTSAWCAARPFPSRKRSTWKRPGPSARRAATILSRYVFPKRHCHGRRHLLPEHRGCHHDRGRAFLHRAGAAGGDPRLGDGPFHGQEVPPVRDLVDDHLPRGS